MAMAAWPQPSGCTGSDIHMYIEVFSKGSQSA